MDPTQEEEGDEDNILDDEEKQDSLGPPRRTSFHVFGEVDPAIRDRYVNGPPELTDAICRHEGVFNSGGCWGDVKGRVIYSNFGHYSQGGNFPWEVRYSCQAHRDEDLKDPEIYNCEVCHNLVKKASAYDDIICKVCHDKRRIQNKDLWIRLNKKEIADISFNHVCCNSLTVSDRRNLPMTLKNYGRVECKVDLEVAEEEEENPVEPHEPDAMDYSNVPVQKFWKFNEDRVRLQMHSLKKLLKKAKRKHETRAMFVNGNVENGDVEVLA